MAKLVLYTNTISPHQLPLSREIVARVGEENFRYIYTEKTDKAHGGLGWKLEETKWCMHSSDMAANEWLENADVVLSGLRCFDLFRRRAEKGLKNFYMTERWFKPLLGIARLFHPRYFWYARTLCRMLESGAVVGLPIGIHAACDMARLCGLMHGDLRRLFTPPKLTFEKKPCGEIYSATKNAKDTKKCCLDKMRMWAYFVERGTGNGERGTGNGPTSFKVLWVGRLLQWKRVDTIIKAVGECTRRHCGDDSLPKMTLDIYGTGPEEARLKRVAAKYGDVVRFYLPVPIAEVRKLMLSHDVYILSSDGQEGWGAVVSEALEEGMSVIGTYEAGSSATMLPESNLFHAGDWCGLAAILMHHIPHCTIGDWTAKRAAQVFLDDM